MTRKIFSRGIFLNKMLTLRATANHVIALQYLCMCLMSQMFLFYFIFLWGCYGGALVFLGGAGAPASPSLAPPMITVLDCD